MILPWAKRIGQSGWTIRFATRKRKCQKSEVLTSSPIKNIQKEKNEANIQKNKKNEIIKKKKLGPSTSGLKVKAKTNENKNLKCLICDENYVEPLTEDWIQCSQCKSWVHESCTSYSGYGSYFCYDCDS